MVVGRAATSGVQDAPHTTLDVPFAETVRTLPQGPGVHGVHSRAL